MNPLRSTPAQPAPDLLDDEYVALLGGSLANAWQAPSSIGPTAIGVRERLLERAAHSARASQAFTTVRRHHAPALSLSSGVRVRCLYASNSSSMRPGEPLRVQLVELAAGARWAPDAVQPGVQREWLVMRGKVHSRGARWSACDYLIEPAGSKRWADISAELDTLIYRREAVVETMPNARAQTSRAADANWEDYAPGIRRRMLWRGGALGAFLFHALPGASVPTHRHRHDEECLMLDGELFIDDELLRTDEYQIAPAGTRHRSVTTDTGVLIYAHGDVDLDVVSC